MTIHHKDLKPEHWFTFSLFEQLANVGMDVERTIFFRNSNPEQSQKAFERALELLDLTIADQKNKGSTRKELTRVREALVDYFVYDNEYGSSDKLWHDYFFAFNYAAALEKGR